jgi:pyridoxamine 5'-phosphate oxidase
MQPSIADIRKDYQLQSLSEKDVMGNPIDQFEKWWNEAIKSNLDEVNAMTLATSSADGTPAARTVLLKGYDHKGFIFFTNYESYKGKQLQENPKATLVFFWKELQRQVIISGTVEKVSAEESDEYFNSRPRGSRIGAWTSPQSSIIENREWLEAREMQMEKKFEGHEITRPPHWGGFRVMPVSIEFWQGRSSRLHDRIQYLIDGANFWMIRRLAP